MNRGTEPYERLKKILTKLYTVRDSCWGLIIFQRYPHDFAWTTHLIFVKTSADISLI